MPKENKSSQSDKKEKRAGKKEKIGKKAQTGANVADVIKDGAELGDKIGKKAGWW